ncbi:hypothetical protein BFW01_g1805 [Lasiodiplodia theobromae]|uniref:BTB domain-containing protein n=1 Tax=Lasiodiplodia theobromae TaxID=45133 RepID=A0A8H7IT31_9PEZI|nr:hypothetical protein BFW01_g1805 [Lasiodiplodia theobromae]
MSRINQEYRKPDRIAEPFLTCCARTFRAGTFDFYVGPDEVHFILYKNLVSRYSEPLGRMMTNGMKESREGKAFLKDVDPDTFFRFAEFIHSGDYSAVDPVEVPLTPEDDDDILSEDEDTVSDKAPSVTSERSVRSYPRSPPPPDDARGQFYDEVTRRWIDCPRTPREDEREENPNDEATPPPPLPFPVDAAPGLNESPSMSYSETFACHISLYYFAELYFVLGLKELAKQKLSEALNIFACFPERTGDICHVVRLVYNHEDGNTHPSPLHGVISQYAANNFKVLTSSRRFKNLLAEGGPFPPDLCRKVARLLN